MNNNTTITKKNDERVARPLKILIPLIKQDLRDADEAAKSAGMPYYIAAGEKLLESKGQINAMVWTDWLRKNFHLSQDTANVYMRAARQTKLGASFETLNQVRGDTRKFGHPPTPPPWTGPVQDVLKRVRVESFNLRQHMLTESKERQLQRKLALQLIDIGFKALSVKLHPDTGGSHDAMQRLNTVRARLKHAA